MPLKKSSTARNGSDTTLDTDGMIEEAEVRPRIFSSLNTSKHTKGKISLMDAGRNSIFSEVNELRTIDKGRRSAARIHQLECDIQSELQSIKQNKPRLGLPPRPDKGQIGIEYDTVDEHGVNSRRKLFVSCSN